MASCSEPAHSTPASGPYDSSSNASLASTADFQARQGGCCGKPFRQTPSTPLLALCRCTCSAKTPARSRQAAAAAPAHLPHSMTSTHQYPDSPAASFSELAAAAPLPSLREVTCTSQPTAVQGGACSRMLPAQHAVLQAIFDTTADYDRVSAGAGSSSASNSRGRGGSGSNSGSGPQFEPSFSAHNSSSSDSSDSSSEGSSQCSVEAPSSSIFELLFAHAGSAAAAWDQFAAANPTSSSGSCQDALPLLAEQPWDAASSSNITHGLRQVAAHPQVASSPAAAAALMAAAQAFESPAAPSSPAAPAPLSPVHFQHSNSPAAPQAAPVAAPAAALAASDSQLLAMQLLSEVCRASVAFGSGCNVSSSSSGAGGTSRSLAGSSSSRCRRQSVTAVGGVTGRNASSVGCGDGRCSSSAGGLGPGVAQGAHVPGAACHSPDCSGGSSSSSGRAVVDPALLQLLALLGLASPQGSLQQQQQQQQQVLSDALQEGTAAVHLQAQQQQEQQELWLQHLAQLSNKCCSEGTTSYYTCRSVWSSEGGGMAAPAPAPAGVGASTGTATPPPAMSVTAAAAAADAGAATPPDALQPGGSTPRSSMQRQHSSASLGWDSMGGDTVLMGSPALSPATSRPRGPAPPPAAYVGSSNHTAAAVSDWRPGAAGEAAGATHVAAGAATPTHPAAAAGGVHPPHRMATVWEAIMAAKVQQSQPAAAQHQHQQPMLSLPPWPHAPPSPRQQQQAPMQLPQQHRETASDLAGPQHARLLLQHQPAAAAAAAAENCPTGGCRTGAPLSTTLSPSSTPPVQAADLAAAAATASAAGGGTRATPAAAESAAVGGSSSRTGGGSGGVLGSSRNSRGSAGDAGCMLGGVQLASMNLGELRELLGRVADLSLGNLQQQMQQG